MSETRRSFHRLNDVVGKTLTGFLETSDDGRIALLFDDDSSIEIYAFTDFDEGCLGTQSVTWQDYEIESAVRARLATPEQAEEYQAKKRATDEKHKLAEIERLQRDLVRIRAGG